MLSRIFIQNFALIDRLEIDLKNGLQVITGETGAGKSIILGALRLIMGERADVKSFAKSDAKSIVETEFQITENFKVFFEENDLDYEAQSIIRREILPNGKSRAFINDVPVTLDILKELSSKLIDIHSQFETSNLFTEQFQFGILDGLAKNKTLLADYQSQYFGYQNTKREIEQLKSALAENNKESDYKNFLLAELEEAQLENIDFEELQNQLNTQENAEQISEQLSQSLSKLNQEDFGILSSLFDVKNKMQKLSELSSEYEEISQRLEASYLELKDINAEIESKADNLEINPVLLQQLLTSINKINALFLKHQVDSIEGLLKIKEELSSSQSSLETIEIQIEEKENQLKLIEAQLASLSKKLSENRIKFSGNLENKAKEIFAQLGLEKAILKIDLSDSATYNLHGKNNIQILFQANSGFPLKPIQGAVSGGERSRVMLAIKKIMAENNALPTLILDEIDTGVSGRIAEEMGKLMKEMSQDLQLIVITHLAQVAAKGNQNYKVVKFDENGITKTTIVELSEDDKLNEIAQLISGSKITEAAISQAKELIG
ncbi:DNA repair protein RecN [Epilithonimonas arachidiradicis]|uniref:DNA repair protein RecN n=1 Tax=Epilithonimonas arachidiradicis TaxID=1617282 RepID=A0A420DDF9_9FLAO|nr:DNA repair protein RecN [Epilithonimonas arachidiradicis]RKE89609.1 DNA repair protein RecN (Recombination protein N) [Epilithonimonas arachidiradicis]GGG43919.1 DNA repair protein RecN [Epilithonimonas arachidiradicis]